MARGWPSPIFFSGICFFLLFLFLICFFLVFVLFCFHAFVGAL